MQEVGLNIPEIHKTTLNSAGIEYKGIIDIYHYAKFTRNDADDLASWLGFYLKELKLDTGKKTIESFVLANNALDRENKYTSDNDFNNIATIRSEPIKDVTDKKGHFSSRITQDWIVTFNYDEIKKLVDQIEDVKITNLILDRYEQLLKHKLHYFFPSDNYLDSLCNPEKVSTLLENIEKYKEETGLEDVYEIEDHILKQFENLKITISKKNSTEKQKKHIDMYSDIIKWKHLYKSKAKDSVLSEINKKMKDINKIGDFTILYIIDKRLNSPDSETPEIAVQYLKEKRDMIESSQEYKDMIAIYEPKIIENKETLDSYLKGIELFTEKTGVEIISTV
ncbi:MAG: hypothetical protein KAS11_01265 [Candidatus Aenigmarchaeota archaeon]|nr:hypothetical protein [Candidatus Aenigmarchaeota archaeon]